MKTNTIEHLYNKVKYEKCELKRDTVHNNTGFVHLVNQFNNDEFYVVKGKTVAPCKVYHVIC